MADQIFILSFTVGDGFTYSCDRAIPIKAESAEYIIVHLELQLTQARFLERTDRLKFYEKYPNGCLLWDGIELCVDDFFFNGEYTAPDIYTLEQWYDSLQVIRG